MAEARVIIEGVENWAHTVWLSNQTEFHLGRSQSNDIQLNDGACSSLHAKIEYKDGSYTLTDKKSRNGTFVNGVKIDNCVLQDRDEICVGKTVMTFLEAALPRRDLADQKTWQDYMGSGVRDEESDRERTTVNELVQTIEALDQTVSEQSSEYDTSEDVAKEIAHLRVTVERLARRHDNLMLQNQMLRLLSLELPMDRRLKTVAGFIAAHFEADNVFLMHIASDGKWLVRASHGGIRDWETKDDAPISLTAVKQCVEKGESVFASEMDRPETDSSDSVMALEIKSLICAPILDEERVHGALYIDRRMSFEPFEPEQRDQLVGLADALTQSI